MIYLTSRPGQLGNQLFLFSHILAFCLEHNLSVTHASFDYTHVFPNLKKELKQLSSGSRIQTNTSSMLLNLVSRLIARLNLNNHHIGYYELDWNQELDLDTLGIASLAKHHFLNGWLFRAPKLLNQHRQAIKKCFEPSIKVQSSIWNALKILNKEYSQLFAIHVRRGDYSNFQDGIYMYSIAEYQRWIEEIRTAYQSQKIGFIIFSDSPEAAALCSTNDVEMGPGGLIEDLFMMSQCDKIIGPPSTFSLWASFFGNKPIQVIKKPNERIDKANFLIPSHY